MRCSVAALATDVHAIEGEGAIPPQAFHRGLDRIDLVGSGEGANTYRADRPVRVEHVHGLLSAQARGSPGVDRAGPGSPRSLAGKGTARNPASGSDQSWLRSTPARGVAPSAGYASRWLPRVAPRNIQDNLELQQRRARCHRIGALTSMGFDGGSVRPGLECFIGLPVCHDEVAVFTLDRT